jgi:hypothetical protein
MEPFAIERRGPRIPPRLIVGLAFVAAGVLLALARFTDWNVAPLWSYWPLLLIAIGVSQLVRPQGGRGGGLWLLGLGTWFLGNNLGWWSLRLHDLFPFAILFVGILILSRAFFGSTRHSGRQGFESAAGATVDVFAMMGGALRASNAPAFRGGHVTAILGGCELDLRQAALAEEGAVIECFTVWGGIQIAVPEGWSVAMEGTPILGGFADRTVQPPPGGSAQRLVIRGVAIMGGVDVRHRFEREGGG